MVWLTCCIGRSLCRAGGRKRSSKKQMLDPDQAWRRDNSIELRWLSLSDVEKARVNRQYESLIARCDAHDAALKRRWLNRAMASSPGVDPLAIEVFDDSIAITASYAFHPPIPSLEGPSQYLIPLKGQFDTSNNGMTHYCAMSFTGDTTQGPVDVPPYPLIPLLTQQSINRERDSRELSNLLAFLQRFSNVGSVSHKQLRLVWRLSTSSSEMACHLPISIRGKSEVLPRVRLLNPITLVSSSCSNLNHSNVSISLMDSSVQFSWPKAEVPADLWQWRDSAEFCLMDAETTAEEGGPVDRWKAHEGPFAGSSDLPSAVEWREKGRRRSKRRRW